MSTATVGATSIVVHIGRRVVEAREARRWDQSELARRAGVTASYVSRLERGLIPKPGAAHIARIAEALGRRPDDLLAPPADPETFAESSALWGRVLAALGPERASLVAETVAGLADLAPDEQDFVLDLFRRGVFDLPRRRPAP